MFIYLGGIHDSDYDKFYPMKYNLEMVILGAICCCKRQHFSCNYIWNGFLYRYIILLNHSGTFKYTEYCYYHWDSDDQGEPFSLFPIRHCIYRHRIVSGEVRVNITWNWRQPVISTTGNRNDVPTKMVPRVSFFATWCYLIKYLTGHTPVVPKLCFIFIWEMIKWICYLLFASKWLLLFGSSIRLAILASVPKLCCIFIWQMIKWICCLLSFK